MRRLLPEVGWLSGTRLFRLLIAAALVGSVPFAVAQRGGAMGGGHFAGGFGHIGGGYGGHIGGGIAGRMGGGYYGHGFAGFSAPNFVSTFGAHSITGSAGSNFVTGGFRFAPNYASSWGIGHPTWRGENGGWNHNRGGNWGRGRDRGRDHRRDRYGYGYPYMGYGYGYPLYSSVGVIPWDLGYPDYSGYDTGYGYSPDDSQNAAAAPPEYDQSAPPQQDENQPPYGNQPPYPPESGYAPPPPSAAPAVSSTLLSTEPELTLIFKDGQKQSIRNYALTSDAVIVLDKASSGRQQRIPLAALNLPATEEAAQAAGLDFAPPK